MSDIKLFRIADEVAAELDGFSAAVEKSLQALIERNSDVFLGVRFLASTRALYSRRVAALQLRGGDRSPL